MIASLADIFVLCDISRTGSLLVLPIGCGGSLFVFVLLCINMCPFKFCNHLEERKEFFALLLLPHRCLVTVNVI